MNLQLKSEQTLLHAEIEAELLDGIHRFAVFERGLPGPLV